MFETPELPNKMVVYENKNATKLKIVNQPIKLTKLKTGYTVKEHQILIKVHTAAFNPIDIVIKNSMLPIVNYIYKHFGLCEDFSGVVVAIGDKAREKYGYNVGDDVCGQTYPPFGDKTLAEHITIDIKWPKLFTITRVPKGLSMNEAGSFSLVYCTAAQAIHLANLKPDSKVLVNGASTSVGKYVVQLLKLDPNVKEVIGICSGKSAPLAKQLGADDVIDYTKTDNITNSVLETCKDRNYDAFLDCCGSYQLSATLSQFMAKNSYVVNITGGKKNNLAAGVSFFSLVTLGTVKNVVLSTLRLTPFTYVAFFEDIGFKIHEGVKLFEEGKLKPFIDTVFLFDRYQEAYDLVVSGKNNGKVAVQMSD